jgi:hypothetical protein
MCKALGSTPAPKEKKKRKKMRDLNPNKPAITLKEPIISIKRQKS